MENLQQLIALGGWSMMAILASSIVLMAVTIFKTVQFSSKGFWTITSPSNDQISTALSGLKIIEVISIIAPLLGLLGTVMGMISAFQNLEALGGAPDINALAGGIWKALSTTAAGMVVAILATIFLGVFDGTVERMIAKKDTQC